MYKLLAVAIVIISTGLFGCIDNPEQKVVDNIHFIKRYGACWAVFRTGNAAGISLVTDKYCIENSEREEN